MTKKILSHERMLDYFLECSALHSNPWNPEHTNGAAWEFQQDTSEFLLWLIQALDLESQGAFIPCQVREKGTTPAQELLQEQIVDFLSQPTDEPPTILVQTFSRQDPEAKEEKALHKLSSPIDFPSSLTLHIGKKQVHYTAQSVSAHHGYSTQGGHYSCYGKEASGQWAHYNDTQTTLYSERFPQIHDEATAVTSILWVKTEPPLSRM